MIFSLSGDGSFGFSAGELETIRRVNANVVIIIFNNGSYGWIRAEMKDRGKDIVGTDFSSPDYVKIAEGYGLSAYGITNDEEISDTLKRAIKNTPSLVEVIVEPEDNVRPLRLCLGVRDFFKLNKTNTMAWHCCIMKKR